MRESRTSGTVGGEGGNILVYPATCTASMPATLKAGMTGEATSGVNREGDSTDAQRQGRSSP
jgi:hypothetical protein